MSSTPLKAMDIYSKFMDVPFDVAAYCRGHKFSVEAVALTRALQSRMVAQAAIDKAERDMAVAMEEQTYAVAVCREKSKTKSQ